VDIETPIELEVCGSGVGARWWTLKPLLNLKCAGAVWVPGGGH
jgi:hypothetical protein